MGFGTGFADALADGAADAEADGAAEIEAAGALLAIGGGTTALVIEAADNAAAEGSTVGSATGCSCLGAIFAMTASRTDRTVPNVTPMPTSASRMKMSSQGRFFFGASALSSSCICGGSTISDVGRDDSPGTFFDGGWVTECGLDSNRRPCGTTPENNPPSNP